MKEIRHELNQTEKLFLENVSLKEQILHRDLSDLKKQREIAVMQICSVRGIDPTNDNFRMERDAVVHMIDEASAVSEATAKVPRTPSSSKEKQKQLS
jgi:hypothetical protein